MNDIEKNNRTGNLHNEMHQIIVSKRELYYQFDNFSPLPRAWKSGSIYRYGEGFALPW